MQIGSFLGLLFCNFIYIYTHIIYIIYIYLWVGFVRFSV